MNDHIKRDDALAAEYALGTLRGQARLRFQNRMQHEPDLAARVARWQTMLSTLDSHLTPVTPPEQVWKKIVLDLPSPASVPRARSWLGWAVAAGLAAVTLTWVSTRAPEMSPLVVLNDTQQQGQWVVNADSRRQALSIAPLRPTPLAAQKSLQLWLIPRGQAPVSLGLVDNRSPTRVDLKNETLAPDAVIAISVEPQGADGAGSV